MKYLTIGGKQLFIGTEPLLATGDVSPIVPEAIIDDDSGQPVIDDDSGQPVVDG